jgi:hypothetical protein
MKPAHVFPRPILALVLSLGLFAPTTPALAQATPAAADTQAVADITTLLNEFLANVDQAATHDRFWATDLVYTSSAGEVTDKAAIMKGFDEAPAPADDQPEAPKDRYTAEDILVRPHGDAAALTFRLVHHAADGKRSFFRNSGMLLRREGRWEVITWQATKVPEPEAK